MLLFLSECLLLRARWLVMCVYCIGLYHLSKFMIVKASEKLEQVDGEKSQTKSLSKSVEITE